MLIRNVSTLKHWRGGAWAAYGDPAAVVCLLAFRWVDDPAGHGGDDLVCGLASGRFHVRLGRDERVFVRVAAGRSEHAPDGSVAALGAAPLGAGVWALSPSLNIPRVVHGYVLLYDVPSPAPWEHPR